MAEYPIIMKQKNDQGDYDILYPKTLGSQVEGTIPSSQITGTFPSSSITGQFPASQIDDIYTKDQTLTQETAALFGLGSDATPDDAFSELFRINEMLNSTITGVPTMQHWSYIGDGTYGASNPMRFTFGGTPLAVFISGEGLSSRVAIRMYRGNIDTLRGSSSGNGTVTWGENYVEFYAPSAAYQANDAGTTYYATAIYSPKAFDGEVSITVTTGDGTPVPGCKIEGVYTNLGGTIYTNASGVARGFSNSNELVKIISAYADLQDLEFQLPELTNEVTGIQKQLSATVSGDTKIYDFSQTIKFLRPVTVNMSLVGGGTGGTGGEGGTGGGDPQPNGYSGYGGAGGSSGYVLNITEAAIQPGSYTLLVGAGGSGGSGGSGGEWGQHGSAGEAGGDTTFMEYNSKNGARTNAPLNDNSIMVGGSGGYGGRGAGSTGSASGSPGSAGTRAGGTGGKGGSSDSYDAENGKNGGPGGGGGGGGGGGSNLYHSGGWTGGHGGRGGDGALVIRF